MNLTDKLKSRKFLVAQQILWMSVSVPVLYVKLGVSSEVILAVLGVIASVGAFYGVSNVLGKKYGGSSE